MKKFRCPICGYTYDEAVGLREKGIPPGTYWEDLPADFACPLCGAPKAVFERVDEGGSAAAPTPAATRTDPAAEEAEVLREMTAGELWALFGNLAKGCEKQGLVRETAAFARLADHYKEKAAGEAGAGLDRLAALVAADLEAGLPEANAEASAAADRGALRALVWDEKVTRMGRSLIDRYVREGAAPPPDAKIYVCDICGFVYVGDALPDVCPVCKVPNFRMTPVARR